MVKKMKRILTVLLCAFLLLSVIEAGFTPVVYASSDFGEANLAIDVVFVIDGSGSMVKSDPDKIAMEACKLFSDMCDYGEARAGFVVFSARVQDKNVHELEALSTQELRNSLHKALNGIKYPEKGGTDISLGLTRAYEMLQDAGSLNSERNPMIILLSDGANQDMKDSRKDVWEQELSKTIERCQNNNVKVHSIALTASSNDHVGFVKNIAEQTGGLFFETSSAADLSGILTKIMAAQLRSNIQPIDEIVGTGKPDTVEIPIPNNSIYQANIIIMSGEEVTDIHLCEPGGSEIALNSSTALLSTSKTYTIIKLIRPEKGAWSLTLTGAEKDQITINLISSYDMELGMQVDVEEEVTCGQKIPVKVFFQDFDGAPIEDNDVFDELRGSRIVAKNLTTGEEFVIEDSLKARGSVLEGEFSFEKPGTYLLHAEVESENFQRQSAEKLELKVHPTPLVSQDDDNESSMLLFTPFILKIKASDSLELSKAITNSEGVHVEVVPGEWEKIVDCGPGKEPGQIEVRALKSGKETIQFHFTDTYGQELEYSLKVTVIPGWALLLAVLLILAVIAFVIARIIEKNKPELGGKLSISMELPPERAGDTPPDGTFDLSFLKTKHPASLRKIIESNPVQMGAYSAALAGIGKVADGLTFCAANKDSSRLKIVLPATATNPIHFQGETYGKKAVKTLSSGEHVDLIYTDKDETFHYRISLTLSGEWDPSNGFESNSSGFGNGGFGANNGGFDNGGFGANNGGFDNGGFGANNGGFDNGGFGANNGGFDNGGFGANNGGFDNGGFGANNGGFGDNPNSDPNNGFGGF